MARAGRGTATPEAEAPEASTQEPTSAEATEPTEASNGQVTEPANTEPQEKPVPALDVFKEAFAAAVEGLSDSKENPTASLTEVIYQPVSTAYKALRGSAKTAAFKVIAEAMKGLIDQATSGDPKHADKFNVVASVNMLQTQLTEAPSKVAEEKAAEAKLDPVQAAVEHRLPIGVLWTYLSQTRPEGMSEDDFKLVVQKVDVNFPSVYEAFTAYVALDDEGRKAQENTPREVRAAWRILNQKGPGRPGTKSASGSGGASTARRGVGAGRSIAAHIAEVFADKPVGTVYKVSEVAAASSERYTEEAGLASQGAIAACMKSKNKLPEGILQVDHEGRQALKKVSEPKETPEPAAA